MLHPEGFESPLWEAQSLRPQGMEGRWGRMGRNWGVEQWARGAAWAGFGGLSSEQWVHGGAWAGSGGLNSGHCVADLVMLLDGVPQFGERHAQGERHS